MSIDGLNHFNNNLSQGGHGLVYGKEVTNRPGHPEEATSGQEKDQCGQTCPKKDTNGLGRSYMRQGLYK